MHFGLTTDFRNPPGSGKTSARVYAEIIDMMVFAESLGFMGICIDNQDQIGDAWDRALSSDRPVIFEAHTDPAISLLPPQITFEMAKEMAITMWKGDPEEVPVIIETAKQMAAGLFPKRGANK